MMTKLDSTCSFLKMHEMYSFLIKIHFTLIFPNPFIQRLSGIVNVRSAAITMDGNKLTMEQH